MIFTSNLVITGTVKDMPVYTNTLAAASMSNISIEGGITVHGSVFSTGRIDYGDTMYGFFRLSSNQSFSNASEIYTQSNWFVYDYTSADMVSMSNVVSDMNELYTLINYQTGVIRIPISGLYHIHIQGKFDNDPNAENVKNGVYFYFKNYTHCNCRLAANISSGDLLSTSHIAYMLRGDLIQPTFFSNDSNAILEGNGETYAGFTILSTITPTHSNYVRVPYSSN